MKKKKIKGKKIIKFLIFIIIIVAFGYFILNLNIKNIYVFNNDILTDQEIIELAGINNYPKLYKTTNKSIKRKLLTSPFISNVKIKKNILGELYIDITEYRILLKNEIDNSIYLSNLKKINYDSDLNGIPTLINSIDDNILNKFLKKLNQVDKNILLKISEIEYSPNEYDNDLFLFYMNDGNHVYITTSKLLNINKYDEIVLSLDSKKGILYLDSGNHFEVFK